MWSQTFAPDTYTINLSGSINVYDLWASNLGAVAAN